MTKFKLSTWVPFMLVLVATFVMVSMKDANAWSEPMKQPPKMQPKKQPAPKPAPKPVSVKQDQSQKQSQKAYGGHADAASEASANADSFSEASSESFSDSFAEASVGAVAGGAANNEGNSLSVSSNYQSGPAEVVQVLNNNTADCQRVYGIGGGNISGNIVLGMPFRDRTCDLEAAADDAFAQGNTALGWVFKCKQKNIKREFGGQDWRRMIGEDKCLEMVNSVDHLNNRIQILEKQKETLLIERKYDHDRCNDEKTAIVDGCMRK